MLDTAELLTPSKKERTRSPRRAKVNQTGRNAERVGRKERSLIIRRSVWHAPHVSALSSNARALLIELTSIFNGKNNGAIFLSQRDAANRLGLSDCKAVSRAFEELKAVGLLTLTSPGYFAVKAGNCRASAWRINWVDTNGQPAGPDDLPTLNLEQLDKKQRVRLAKRSRSLKAYFRILSSEKNAEEFWPTLTPPIEPTATDSGGKTTTISSSATTESASLQRFGGLVESSTHILHQRGRAQTRCERCQLTFEATRVTQRFCTSKCRTASEKARAYKRSHPKKVSAAGWWASISTIVARVHERKMSAGPLAERSNV